MRAAPPPNLGLCATCVHGRVITGARSNFLRCGLADSDTRFRRYPPLPVLRCDGFTKVDREDTGRPEVS